jgi:hypothetical protein
MGSFNQKFALDEIFLYLLEPKDVLAKHWLKNTDLINLLLV